MKIVEKLGEGVFKYSNGMVGTSNLPVFVAQVCTKIHKMNKKQKFMLDSIKTPVTPTKLPWRGQLVQWRIHHAIPKAA